jgi:non-ribosomal peptide synthetase component F
LYRHSGKEDIVVGSPIAGRNMHEIENLVGYFINILVLRVKITSSMKFDELLKQISDTALESYEYQDLPFEKLLEALSIEQNVRYNPLFQIMFILHNTHENIALDLNGIKTREVSYNYPVAKFDLLLALTEKEGRLQGRVEYATDLFKSTTIERIMTDYLKLLEAIVTNQEYLLTNLCRIPKKMADNA